MIRPNAVNPDWVPRDCQAHTHRSEPLRVRDCEGIIIV